MVMTLSRAPRRRHHALPSLLLAALLLVFPNDCGSIPANSPTCPSQPLFHMDELGGGTIVNRLVPRSAFPPTRTLSIVSYNIYQMSRYLFPNWAQNPRVSRLVKAEFIKDHDVLIFQEAWDGKSRQILLDGLRDLGYIHQTPVTGNGRQGWDKSEGQYCWWLPYNGGVVIVSKWKITYKATWVFRSACGLDWFSNKGFAYARIEMPNANLHLVGTHLQADDSMCPSNASTNVRSNQLEEISKWLSGMKIPVHEPVVFAGDFNIHRPWGDAAVPGNSAAETRVKDYTNLSEYESMLKILAAAPAKHFKGAHYTRDTKENSIAQRIDPTANREYLDHVLVQQRSIEHSGMMMETSEQTALNSKTTPFAAGVFGLADVYSDISDHYPVIFNVTWAAT